MRVLIAQSSRVSASLVRRAVVKFGHSAELARDGKEGQRLAESRIFDVIILDRELAGKDGISICRDLRLKRISTPILIVSEGGNRQSRIDALDAGADDFLPRPFAEEELLARLRALRRRDLVHKSAAIQVGELTLDTLSRTLLQQGRLVRLTTIEYAILERLFLHPDLPLDRRVLEDEILPPKGGKPSELLDAYIHKLRGKIDLPGRSSLIQTIRGYGYRLADPG